MSLGSGEVDAKPRIGFGVGFGGTEGIDDQVRQGARLRKMQCTVQMCHVSGSRVYGSLSLRWHGRNTRDVPHVERKSPAIRSSLSDGVHGAHEPIFLVHRPCAGGRVRATRRGRGTSAALGASCAPRTASARVPAGYVRRNMSHDVQVAERRWIISGTPLPGRGREGQAIDSSFGVLSSS